MGRVPTENQATSYKGEQLIFLRIRSNEWGQDSEVRLIDASRNFHLAILLAHFSQNTEPMKKQI